MARVARFKVKHGDAWYHIHSRIAGHQGEYPLAQPVVMRRLIDIIEHFSRIYFCEVAAFSIPGSHYHLVVKFEEERPVSREKLREKTRLMYPSKFRQAQIDLWSDEQWEHYRKRLFDVSEFTRNVQSAFARPRRFCGVSHRGIQNPLFPGDAEAEMRLILVWGVSLDNGQPPRLRGMMRRRRDLSRLSCFGSLPHCGILAA